MNDPKGAPDSSAPFDFPDEGVRVKIGVSSCLLGNRVRYDGDHKLDPYVTQTLGRGCDLVAVCPELEVGLGVPRPPLHLEGDPQSPRMIVTETGEDITDRMNAWAATRVEALAALDLDGYVFKSNSPSCGMEGVDVGARMVGQGLFAAALMRRLPRLPVEDERRLQAPQVRVDFIERVRAYRGQRLST